MEAIVTVPERGMRDKPAPSPPGPMKGQVVAFFTGALFVAAGLIVAFFMFIGPTPALDPVSAWCRGWIDGLSYTDFRSGNEYEPQTLDDAEAKCYTQFEAGLRAPAARGPLTPDP